MHPLDPGHPDYEQMQDAGRAPSHHDPILPERRTLIRRRADGFRADVLRGERGSFEGEVLERRHEHVWVAGEIIGRSKYGWVVGSNCMVCGEARYPSSLTSDDRTVMERMGLS